MILYYLVKGLSHIDFYWGVVVRYIELEEQDMEDYKPGEIMTWLQFSSSDKGGKDMTHFNDRNTTFIISSLTGRSIQNFSNCADQEDEVLFLPHSSFLVCNVIRDKNRRKNKIYLRQVGHFFY
jgi:CRISPR/Cas system endoribonuclease Cas6 (RAMP superfamily)